MANEKARPLTLIFAGFRGSCRRALLGVEGAGCRRTR